jgi:hypothetical protein
MPQQDEIQEWCDSLNCSDAEKRAVVELVDKTMSGEGGTSLMAMVR